MWLICSNGDVSADATRGHGAGSVRVRVATLHLGRPWRCHVPQMAKPNGIDLVGVGQQHRLEDGQVEHLEASGTVGWGALEHRLEQQRQFGRPGAMDVAVTGLDHCAQRRHLALSFVAAERSL